MSRLRYHEPRAGLAIHDLNTQLNNSTAVALLAGVAVLSALIYVLALARPVNLFNLH